MADQSRDKRDKLERFIIDHRSELDTADPPPEIWDALSNSFDSASKSRKIKPMEWVWRVAAVIFFGLSIFLLIDKIEGTGESEDIAEIRTEDKFTGFSNAEKYYSQIINIKKQELSEVIDNDNPLNNDFQKDILELDSVYQQLKKDFDNNNDELVMDAMIHNLQLRVDILDRQLKIIDNLNHLREKRDENVTI